MIWKCELSRYREQFPARNTVLPVVHVESEEQAVRNVGIAQAEGCDGAFLINHRISSGHLLEIHAAVGERFPGYWLGLNCLDLTPAQTFSVLPATASGLWVDNAAIDEQAEEQPAADAIASGITPENVGLYLVMAGCFLVATGISASFVDLDPARVRALLEVVRSGV